MLHIDLVERDDLSGEIYRQIKRAIISNILRPEDALPATRELARTLNVARATVVIAYERLEADGFIQSRQGAGTFVRGSTQATNSHSQKEQLRVLVPRPIWDAIPLPTAFDRSALFDFRTGAPDATLFPHRHWRKLISSALREIEKSANGVYPSPAGHLGLRRSCRLKPDRDGARWSRAAACAGYTGPRRCHRNARKRCDGRKEHHHTKTDA